MQLAVNPTQDYAGAPSAGDVREYLTEDTSWDDDAITQALAAEADDQLRRCRFPLSPPTLAQPMPEPVFTPALAEALCRRVAHNLAVRALPLGLQASITDGAVATNRVGGLDAEARRLEAPYRRIVIG